MLKLNQVELGNVFYGVNYRGENVKRRLVGGTYGTVEKWFLIDADTFELKSRVRETKEEVLEGFEIEAISSTDFVPRGMVSTNVEEFEFGDIFYARIDEELVPRLIVGGLAYGEEIYFTIDPSTGKRCSRTRESIEEVLEHYEVEFILK